MKPFSLTKDDRKHASEVRHTKKKKTRFFVTIPFLRCLKNAVPFLGNHGARILGSLLSSALSIDKYDNRFSLMKSIEIDSETKVFDSFVVKVCYLNLFTLHQLILNQIIVITRYMVRPIWSTHISHFTFRFTLYVAHSCISNIVRRKQKTMDLSHHIVLDFHRTIYFIL